MQRKSSWQSLFSWLFVPCLFVASLAGAADWPQFRGTDREGVGSEEGLLTTWEEGQPAIVWRQPIGTGYSAVTIVGGRLYTMSADDSHEHVLCLDAATGETVWKVEAGSFVQAELGDGGPRSTPTVDDGVVFTATSQSSLLALDADDGSILWTRDLTELGKVPRFGYSTSPLVDQGVVIVEVGDPDKSPGIAAFDRVTGQ
jgi:outer membrane protein assembly factor BamB